MKGCSKGTWLDLKVKGGFPEAETKEPGHVEGGQRMDESDRLFRLHRRIMCEDG